MRSGTFRRDRSGFTLIEIAVVLGILGVAMVSALPFLQQWKEASDLRSAAGKVMGVMLSARMRAVVERRDYTVSVDYATDSCLVSPPTGALASGGGSVDLYDDSSDPDCPSLSSQSVTFRANSTATATGFEAIYLRSRSAKVLVRYRVKVLGATGKISLEKWAGGAWGGVY